MSSELNDFFKLLSEDKKKKKEEFDSVVGDLGLDSLFGEFAQLKKKQKEEKDKKKQNKVENKIKIEEKKQEEPIIQDIDLNSVFKEVSNLKKETKKKKVQEEKTVKAFEKWLYSDTLLKQEEVINGVIEDSLEEVLEVIDDHKEELEELNESKEEISQIEEEIIEESVDLLVEVGSEPANIKQQDDPLTPLNQNFATLEDLNNHYKLFLSRIQQQLSSLGGGGETRLEYLDDVDRNSAKVNGRFLKYDAASGKWIGALSGAGGSQTLDDTLGLGNTSSLGMSVGVITATYFVGDGSLLTNVPGSANSGYANTAGIATYASTAGIATYATNAGISTYATRAGIATYSTSSGIATYASTAGIATVAQGLTGTPNITVGVVTATKYYGDGSSLTGINAGGITSTSSINTTGIITANSYYVGSTQVINSAGQWIGSGLSVHSNIDGGLPNSIYGGIPVIDGGGV